MNNRFIVGLIVFAVTGVAIAALWLWPRSVPWAEPVPLAAPYPPLDHNSQPSLVRTSQLPALVGYQSPKPVVAADVKSNVVVVAYGTMANPLGSDILAWRSADRGDTWEPPKHLTDNARNGEFNFDPWLETDGRGHYYIVYVLASDGRPLIRRTKDAAK